MSINKLSKEERNFLYYFVKNKSMSQGRRTSISFFLPEFNGIVYDSKDVREILQNLVKADYLLGNVGKIDKKTTLDGSEHYTADMEYGIKDKSTYQQLYREYRIRLFIDKLRDYIIKLWEFLWKHFIITILTTIITTYIIIKLFGDFSH